MRIELRLSDGRILQFQKGEQTLRPSAGSFREQDIASVVLDDLSTSERPSRGPDFILSEPGKPNYQLAVELKRGTSRSTTPSSQNQLSRYTSDLFRKFGRSTPLQLWILSSDASRIDVSNYTAEHGLESPTIYHLADISTRLTGIPASADRIVAGTAEVDTAHVKARLDDWEQRIGSLYDNISKWCAAIPDVETDQRLTISIDEEMMQRFAVPARTVPMLRLMRGAVVLLTFKPYGLWIIGANGRLDVLASEASYFLIDVAEQFASPIWKLFGGGERRIQNQRLSSGIDFTPKALAALLGG